MINRMESARLCPKCGAYWKCDCVIEAPEPQRLRSQPRFERPQDEPAGLIAAPAAACQHDWSEVVGVELDDDAVLGEAQVMVCRLCGLYAVEKSA
jgi:hypothetical protein